jgi:hypothetical protein
VDKPARPKILVRAGVEAAKIEATGRTTPELRLKIRTMVERCIVQMAEVAKKEFLQVADLELLQRLNKLLSELDAPETVDPSKMTDEQLAKAAK